MNEKTFLMEPASVCSAGLIDAKMNGRGDWREQMLEKLRGIIREANQDIVEEWKWAKSTSPGIPVWSLGGIICTGEIYRNVVKMTFAKGAALEAALADPAELFNASLDGRVRRAIDISEGDTVDEVALKALIRAAVELNLRHL